MGLLSYLLFRGAFVSPGTGDRPLHSAAAGYLLDFYHPVSRSAGRDYLSCLSRRFPTLDWSASPSKCFRAASALANSKLRFATIRRPETTKSSATSTWTMAISSQARAAFDKAIAARADTPDPFYRRGVCAIQLGDAAAALPDLERVVAKDPDYDFHRAAGLLAHAYAQTGQKEKAEALFRQVTVTSTLSETYLNFADLLASEGRNAEAREWAQKVLDKKPTMPGYLRRRERPWFRRAKEVLKRVPA